MNTTIISALIPNAKDMARTQIAHVLNRFNESLLRRVVAANIKIRPLANGERFVDASPIMRERDLDVDSWQYPPAGLFIVAERCVYLRSLSDMTVAHEFGHAIDCALGDGAYYSEQSNDVTSAFATATRFVTSYAASRIDEYFAESVRAYVEANDPGCSWPKVSRLLLQAYDPTMYAIIQRILQGEAP